MAELNDAQFPKPGSLRFKKAPAEMREDRGVDYATPDGKWGISKGGRGAWHVAPVGESMSYCYPTKRDAEDYANAPAEWDPAHKKAWLEGTGEGG